MARANVRITKEQNELLNCLYTGDIKDLLDERVKDFNMRCKANGVESQFASIFKYRMKRKQASSDDKTLQKDVTVTIRTDDDSFSDFKHYCDIISLTVSEVMRSLLSEYIEQETRREVKESYNTYKQINIFEEA